MELFGETSQYRMIAYGNFIQNEINSKDTTEAPDIENGQIQLIMMMDYFLCFTVKVL